MFACVGLTMRLGLYLAEKSHPLIVLGTNQVLGALCMLICSYVDDIWLFIFFYGIMFGLVAGASFMVAIV